MTKVDQYPSSIPNLPNPILLLKSDSETDTGMEEELIPGLSNDVAMDCLIKVPHSYHSSLRAVCHDWRSQATSPSFYRHRRLSCVAEPLICLIQSHTKELTSSGKSKNWTPTSTYGLTLYNCLTGAWHRHPAITVPIFAQCIAIGDKIILLGGWDSTTLDAICDVHIVDVITGECRRGKSMLTPRSFFACAVVGSLLYVAGGHDNQKNALKTAEVYDLVADEWRQLPPMLEERDECQGVTIGGKFLVISGYDTDNQGIFRRGGECYDPVNGNWEKQDDRLWGDSNDDDINVSSSIHSPRSVCFVLPKASDADEEEEKIWHLECSERGRSMREYDQKQRRWRVVADIPANLSSSPFVSVFRNSNASAGDDGVAKLFVVGSDGEKKHKSWMMNTVTKKWVELHFPNEFSGFAYSPAALCV